MEKDDSLEKMSVSDLFQHVLSLGVFQPMRGPAGFHARSVLQPGVILPQFRVTLRRQPAGGERGIYN